ncbi:MAG: hypothetical protein DCC52_10810 [Chloroflexi bacterium]|nr:MAG: hypothetical protein DCC52_10810 [Chloroflexota bacterium]
MTYRAAQYLYFRPVCIDLRCNAVKKTLRVRVGKRFRKNKKRETKMPPVQRKKSRARIYKSSSRAAVCKTPGAQAIEF